MVKNKFKIVVSLIIFMLLLSTISFATEIMPRTNETAENEPATISEDEHSNDTDEITQDDIHNGDLYLCDSNVVMDKLVDGNVFIIGQDVKITGRVNGCVYVLAKTLTVSEDSYIIQSLYACAEKITLNGAVTDLYACCDSIDMPINSFVMRDLRVLANTLNFAGGVGRNAYITANTFTFANEGENTAIIYGDLNYSSSNELSLSKELVNGEISYSKLENTEEPISVIIADKIVDLCSALVYTAIVFLLVLWLAPNFAKQSSSFIGKKSLVCFGYGILGFIVACVGIFLLLFTYVCVPVSVAVFALLALMISISSAITAICISYKVKEKYTLKNDNMYALILMLVAIVLWLLKLIPYVGVVVSILVSLFGFGVILVYLFEKSAKVKKNETKVEKK